MQIEKDKFILAYDLGTSGCKTCLFKIDGSICSTAYVQYPTYYLADNGVEQDPEDWWAAVKRSSSAVLANSNASPNDILAVTFSSQGSATIPVDNNGVKLREKAMIWMDARAHKESEELLNAFGEEYFYKKTGSWTGFSSGLIPRLKWIKKYEPDVYRRTFRFLGCKEYIILKLTGKMDYTDAVNARDYMDIDTFDVDYSLLEFAEIDLDKLPRVAECHTVIGNINPRIACELGLCSGTRVVLGSWDNTACAIGGGVALPGNSVLYMGTAAWIGLASSQRLGSWSSKIGTFRNFDDFYFHSFNSHSSGVAFNWIVDLVLNNNSVAPSEILAAAESLAKTAPPGSGGVLHIPAYYGGNTMWTDSRIKATFMGIGPTTTRADLIRSVMEGVASDICLGVEFFQNNDIEIAKIRAVGGAAKNAIWVQIFSDMLGLPIEVPKSSQFIGALGAMAMAGVGIGIYHDYKIVESLLEATSSFYPTSNGTAFYSEHLQKYRQIFNKIACTYIESDN